MIMYTWLRYTCLSRRTRFQSNGLEKASIHTGKGHVKVIIQEEVWKWPLASPHQNCSPQSQIPKKLPCVCLRHLDHSSLDSLCWEPNTMRKLCGDKQRPLPHMCFSVGYHDCRLSHVIYRPNFHPIKPTETVFLWPGPHHCELKNHLCEVSNHPQVWGKASDALVPCVCVFTNVFTHVQVHVSVWGQVEVRGQHGVSVLRNCLFVFVTGFVTSLGLTK